GHWEADSRELAAPQLAGLRGNQDRKVWQIHYQNFLREGWGYLRAKHFIHHCTDGPECPVAFAFSQAEARRMFRRFRDVRMKVAHFPLRKYSKLIPFAVERQLASKIGWYLFIFAFKPQMPQGGPKAD